MALRVIKLAECGYEQAALGFSFSFNTSIDRAKQLLPKYAWGKAPGENKFLRVIELWLDVDFPRLIWPECDQYKIATTTLSESTVHTLSKRPCTLEDFIEETDQRAIDLLNEMIVKYKNKEISLLKLKANLPEGFLQRRMWHMNYANFQNIVVQRTSHKVELWDAFIDEVISQIEHPEFVVPNLEKGKE